jgi:hypothetical protein
MGKKLKSAQLIAALVKPSAMDLTKIESTINYSTSHGPSFWWSWQPWAFTLHIASTFIWQCRSHQVPYLQTYIVTTYFLCLFTFDNSPLTWITWGGTSLTQLWCIHNWVQTRLGVPLRQPGNFFSSIFPGGSGCHLMVPVLVWSFAFVMLVPVLVWYNSICNVGVVHSICNVKQWWRTHLPCEWGKTSYTLE